MSIYRRIIAAIDESGPSSRALEHAIRLAADQNAQLRIVTVIDYVAPPFDTTNVAEGELHGAYRAASDGLLARAREIAHAHGLDAETDAIDPGDPRVHASEAILGEIERWQPDLVVMGAHGRAGLSRAVFGSVAESVLRGTSVPLLVLRQIAD